MEGVLSQVTVARVVRNKVDLRLSLGRNLGLECFHMHIATVLCYYSTGILHNIVFKAIPFHTIVKEGWFRYAIKTHFLEPALEVFRVADGGRQGKEGAGAHDKQTLPHSSW